MYNSIVNSINNQIQTDEPDIQMVKEFLFAIHSGCQQTDVIGLLPDFTQKLNAYVTYGEFLEKSQVYAKKLCESQFKQVTTTPNPLSKVINRSWGSPANHREDEISRLTNFVLDFDRKDDKKPNPASQSELDEIFDAREAVFAFLSSIGFISPIKAFSGNGYYLIYPLSLELKEFKKTAFKSIYNYIADVIQPFKNVKVDKSFFDCFRQNLPIAGTINRKFPDSPRFRELEDCPRLEDLSKIRKTNSEVMRFLLASVNLKESNHSICIKGETNDSKYSLRNEAQAAWESSVSWESVLEGSGATKLKEFNGYAEWRRDGKESGSLSFVTGSNKGGSDRLYSYSTNSIFPSATSLTKYWAFLTVRNWVVWNGNKPKIVNKDAKEKWFQSEIMKSSPKSNYQFVDSSEVPNESEFEESESQQIDDGKSKGSLDNFEMPGILKVISEYQNNLSTFECMSLAKATSPWLYSSWIGKTRVLWDGLPLNVNGVILAPRSSGKESVKDIVGNTNYLPIKLKLDEIEKIIGEKIDANRKWDKDLITLSLAGTKTGSAEGFEELLVKYGRVMCVWDEGEGVVISSPKDKPNENLDKIRNLINGSWKCGVMTTRPVKDVDVQAYAEYRLNCLTVTQISSFFKRLNILGNDNAAKGNLGRYYYAALFQSGLANRDDSPSRFKMPEEMIKSYFLWRHLNLKGDPYRNYSSFKPTSFQILQASKLLISDTFDYSDALKKEAQNLDKDGHEILAAIVSRECEYAKKFMGIFSLAEDFDATHVTPKAWELGKKFARISRMVIEKELVNHNTAEWQEKLNKLLNKVRVNKTEGISFRQIRQDILGKHFTSVDDLTKHLDHLTSTGELVLRPVGKGFKYFLGKNRL